MIEALLIPSVKPQTVYILCGMSKLLSISAELSEPPSSPAVFRDVTLWASIFRGYEVVATSQEDMIDYYASWFHRYGLWDYVSDLLPPTQLRDDEVVMQIEGGPGAKLTAENLSDIIALL